MNHDFEMTMAAGYQGPDVSGVSGRVGTGTSMNFMGYSNPNWTHYLKKVFRYLMKQKEKPYTVKFSAL